MTQQNLNDFRSTLERIDAKFGSEISDLKSTLQVMNLEITTLKSSESDLKLQLREANGRIVEIEKTSAELLAKIKIFQEKNEDGSRVSSFPSSGNSTTIFAVSGRPGARGFPGPMGPPGLVISYN